MATLGETEHWIVEEKGEQDRVLVRRKGVSAPVEGMLDMPAAELSELLRVLLAAVSSRVGRDIATVAERTRSEIEETFRSFFGSK